MWLCNKECQQAGLISALDSQMVESLFKVASLCMKVAQDEHADLLQKQRKDKLRKQEEIKTK